MSLFQVFRVEGPLSNGEPATSVARVKFSCWKRPLYTIALLLEQLHFPWRRRLRIQTLTPGGLRVTDTNAKHNVAAEAAPWPELGLLPAFAKNAKMGHPRWGTLRDVV